jgi:hypothetical protein
LSEQKKYSATSKAKRIKSQPSSKLVIPEEEFPEFYYEGDWARDYFEPARPSREIPDFPVATVRSTSVSFASAHLGLNVGFSALSPTTGGVATFVRDPANGGYTLRDFHILRE